MGDERARSRFGGSPTGTLRHVKETPEEHRATEQPADEPRVEAATRAVARLLANPRRTRRS